MVGALPEGSQEYGEADGQAAARTQRVTTVDLGFEGAI